MQTAYFLGGASSGGFVTAFWQQTANMYGYHVIGGPGTGKSTLMKTIANAFAGEAVSLYHCASDPNSLDAVVLEERGVYFADATAPHEHSTPLPFVTGETVDLAALLCRQPIAEHAERIAALQTENQSAHRQARRFMGGMGEMHRTLSGIGKEALLEEKLTTYGKRLVKRLLPAQKGCACAVQTRQLAALTPQGWLTYVPQETEILVLEDAFLTAAPMLLRQVADAAAAMGIAAEQTVLLLHPQQPILHLYLPALHLLLMTATPILPCRAENAVHLRMQRFYDTAILREKRTLSRFCMKTAQRMMQHTAALLSEALTVHDALEQCYLAGMQREALCDAAQKYIAAVRAR